MIASSEHRHPDGPDRRRLGRHRPVPQRWRHDGLALAAAGRYRRPRGGGGAGREGQGRRRPPARGRRRGHRARRRQRRASTSPAPAPSAGRGPTWPPPPATAALERGRDLHRRPVPRSPSAATSPWSRSTRRPARSATCARSPCDDAGGSSTRCCSTARSTAASRRARRRRCSRRCATTRTATRITSNLADYAFPSAAELPSFELVAHGDTRRRSTRSAPRASASRAPSARRRPSNRGGRRAAAPRRPPPRHADHPAAGVGGHRRRPGLTGLTAGHPPDRPAGRPLRCPSRMLTASRIHGPDPGQIDDTFPAVRAGRRPGSGAQGDQVWRSTVIAASASSSTSTPRPGPVGHQEVAVVQLERCGQVARVVAT